MYSRVSYAHPNGSLEKVISARKENFQETSHTSQLHMNFTQCDMSPSTYTDGQVFEKCKQATQTKWVELVWCCCQNVKCRSGDKENSCANEALYLIFEELFVISRGRSHFFSRGLWTMRSAALENIPRWAQEGTNHKSWGNCVKIAATAACFTKRRKILMSLVFHPILNSEMGGWVACCISPSQTWNTELDVFNTHEHVSNYEVSLWSPKFKLDANHHMFFTNHDSSP